MKKQIEAVELFHKTFNAPVGSSPKSIPQKRYDLRWRLMEEENEEYITACKEDNIVEISDALGDMLYILCGTIIEHGMQDKIEDVFKEIQASNMSKLDENGEPIFREDGKVLKGKNYFKPDIKKILEKDDSFNCHKELAGCTVAQCKNCKEIDNIELVAERSIN